MRRGLARLAVAGGLVLVAVGIDFLARHDPSQAGVYPPCPVFALTGLRCPGCGTLRALHALLAGDLAAAWAANPLAVLALPLMLWAVVTCLAFVAGRPWRAPRWLSPRAAPWVIAAFALIMLARIPEGGEADPADPTTDAATSKAVDESPAPPYRSWP